MTLTIYILIAIPICILTILIWAYFDYQKYKREHHLIILLSFLFPTLSHAQYVDNEKCCISFKTYENHQGILEYIKENVTYQFIPSSNAWKVNGKASGVSFYPSTTGKLPMESINSNHEINRTITASNLITGKGIGKIYNKRSIRKGQKTSATIVLPIKIGSEPPFYHTFNFIVTQDN